jgi:putative ABC transport system permease protein
MVDTIWQDLRYALRVLVKKPGFTAVAVLTLALGIGVNSAIFSVVNAVLLRPLPYPQPEQLAMVWLDNRRQGIPDDITSYPNYMDMREQNQGFQDLAAYSTMAVNLTGAGEPEELRAAMVTPSFFQVMGVHPTIGRAFAPEEETPGKDRVVVLGHGFWQRRFGGDRNIVGRTLNLSGEPHVVAGIMPPGFQFPERVELWGPLAPSERLRAARGQFWLPVVGRLKPGVTRAQAQADMSTIANRLEQQYPQMRGYGINIVPLHEQVTGKIRPALLVLLGAVAFVLLIACANVANLLLARAGERQQELAIRTALGAARGRILRQLLTESVLLAAAGGAVGALLAVSGVDLLRTLNPANIPRLENVRLDGQVLGFTLAISLFTALIFGLAPALQASKPHLSETLKEGGRTGAGGLRSRHLRGTVVVIETALALVLLIGAGLMIKSFWQLQRVDPGFNPDRLLTVRLRLPRTKYPEGANVAAFYEQLQERLAALPGVQSVGATSSVLVLGLANSSGFSIEGRPAEPEAERLELPFDAATPNYFQTMGMTLVKGRTFTAQDSGETTKVAVINETMVRRYWPDDDPLGKRFKFGDAGSNAPWITIVGVIRDVRRQGLDRPIRIESYLPHQQLTARSMEIVVRTIGDPLTLAGAVREAVWSLDRDLPIGAIQTMEHILARTTSQRQLNMLLLGLFASVALILSAVGIYGVMAYSVTQRTHEIGIRMALGAARRDVLKLVVGQAAGLTFVGVAIGLVAAFALTRFMSSLLFGVSATDPVTFALISMLLIAVALLASYVPARRAMKVDPMIALRYE